MTDEELIAAMRDLSAGPSSYLQDMGNAAADRIEALVKERDDAVIKRAAWELEAKTQQARAVTAPESCPCGSDVTDMDGHIMHYEGCPEDWATQPALEQKRCGKCNGRGYIQWHPYWDNGNDPCDACNGKGSV